MAAPVLLHHVVGDLTLGKPDLVEFYDTETLEAAIKAIGEQSEGAIAVWRKRGAQILAIPGEDPRVTRFVGMLNSLDVVAFIARVGDHEAALRSPVSEVVTPNASLLKEVDPGTRFVALNWMHNAAPACRFSRASVPSPALSSISSIIAMNLFISCHCFMYGGILELLFLIPRLGMCKSIGTLPSPFSDFLIRALSCLDRVRIPP